MTKISLTALLAGFATLAQAVKLTNSDYDVVAGQSFTIKWADAEGAVSIRLKSGPANKLVTVEEIASGQFGGSYTWSVPLTLETTQYAIEIQDDAGNINYSIQFPVSEGDDSQTTASAAESTLTTPAESSPTTARKTSSTTAPESVTTAPESSPTTAGESVPTTTPESAQTTHARESSTSSTTHANPTSSKASESGFPNNNSASGRYASVLAGLVAGAALLVAY